MHSKLYRFEIIRALSNAVFEAIDPTNRSTVFLYEWTPAPQDRTAAKQRLEEVSGELNCEVFTADASLYIAAVSRQFRQDALNTLRTHGLFTGQWPDDPPVVRVTPPPPTPKRQETPPPPPSIQPPPKSGKGWVWAVAITLIASIGAYCFGLNVAKNSYQSTLAANSLSSDSERRQLQEQLNNQTQFAQNTSNALATYSGTHLLRVKNDCLVPVHTAVLFFDYNHQLIAKGWTQIGPGETAIVAASPSSEFDIYSETLDQQTIWGDNSHDALNVLEDNFAYAYGTRLPSDPSREVHPLIEHINNPGDYSELNCKK